MTGCCYVDVRHLRDDGSRKDVFALVRLNQIDTTSKSPPNKMNYLYVTDNLGNMK